MQQSHESALIVNMLQTKCVGPAQYEDDKVMQTSKTSMISAWDSQTGIHRLEQISMRTGRRIGRHRQARKEARDMETY